MGVSRRDYVVYGWKLPYLDDEKYYDDDKYLSMIEGHEGEDYLLDIDGMNGEYTVFGYRVAIDSGEPWIGWDFVDLDIDTCDSEFDVIKMYEKVFGSIPETPPKLFIYSSYG